MMIGLMFGLVVGARSDLSSKDDGLFVVTGLWVAGH